MNTRTLIGPGTCVEQAQPTILPSRTVLDDRSVARGEALMAAGEALVGFRSALLRLESTGVHIAAAIAVINNIADNIGINN